MSFDGKRLTRRRERGGVIRTLIVLLFLAVVCFALFLLRDPILRFVGNFFVVEDPLQPSDAIVILGDDNYDAVRAARAAELLKAGWAPRIIASGRYLRPYMSIAELMQRDLVERGVPAGAIVTLPHHAGNTREEAIAIRQLLTERNWRRIIVVTSNYHTRRSRYIFSRVLPSGFEARIESAPDSDFNLDRWWQTRSGLKIFLHESIGFVVAWWELRHSQPQASSSLVFVPAAILRDSLACPCPTPRTPLSSPFTRALPCTIFSGPFLTAGPAGTLFGADPARSGGSHVAQTG